MERININEYYMNIAVQVSLRSTCTRRRVGAVIVKENRILSTGYNGAPSKLINCSDCKNRCYRSLHNIPSGEKLDLCYAIHAEQNAIMNALRTGESLEGATIYITTFPCSTCAKLILQSGIKDIFFIDTYKDDFTKELLIEAGAKLTNVDGSRFQTPKGVDVKTVDDLDSIDPLVGMIYKYKPGTKEFIENRDKIFMEKGLYDRYDELIFSTTAGISKEIVPADVKMVNRIPIDIANRNSLEYNGSSRKQMVVASIVYDTFKDEYYVLKCLGERLKGKLTMIQGHASADKEIRELGFVVGNDVLMRYNMVKELGEEIKLTLDHQPSINLKYIINTNDNKISSEHMGVLYIVNIDSSRIDMSEITSGEPEKHELVKFSSEEFFSEQTKNKMDTWLRKFVDELQK